MKILMLTNTYQPHVGGVARSVASFAGHYRHRGHEVVIVAPEFAETPPDDEGVVRIPAVQNFNGSDFSVPVAVPGYLTLSLEGFEPQIVHAHHPFLLGDTALRVAALRNLPVVFTHHTRYEQYTHYVPGDSETMKRFAIDLATGFCNLCNAVFAPSESIAEFLRTEGVTQPVHVVPTGIDPARLISGDGAAFRARHGIAGDGPVVGHVGRLAPEKNLAFLAEAVAEFLRQTPTAWFVVAGSGPAAELVRQTMLDEAVAERYVACGSLDGDELASAYRAMDVFAFASHSETQGMVLAEAMTADVPVVAVNASGVRDIVRDGVNGRLLPDDDRAAMVEALSWIVNQTGAARDQLIAGVRATAAAFSLTHCGDRALGIYADLVVRHASRAAAEDNAWERARRALAREWDIWSNRAGAFGSALADAAIAPEPGEIVEPGLAPRQGNSLPPRESP